MPGRDLIFFVVAERQLTQMCNLNIGLIALSQKKKMER
jgi:hypothetical protein